MTTGTPEANTPEDNRSGNKASRSKNRPQGSPSNQKQSDQKQPLLSGFFLGLLIIVLMLLAAGAGGFWYLGASSPLTLLAGGDRTIAAATAFIPEQSPITLSLLTKPDKLIALQQALISPEQQQASLADVQQLKQNLSDRTGLDYDRDIQPWIGNEVTVALTEQDLDLAASNGDQPGYVAVMEIAGDRTRQAREFLQIFWQRQTLAGAPPTIEQVSGVRVLYSQPGNSAKAPFTGARTGARTTAKTGGLTTATALVGDQFVMFANDVRVLRRSIRSAQTATNLAQNKQYRQAVSQLDESRLGLAYVNTAAIGDIGRTSPQKSQPKTLSTKNLAAVPPNFVAVGLGITEKGISANALLPQRTQRVRSLTYPSEALTGSSGQQATEVVEALKFLPSNSAIALASRNLGQLAQALPTYGISPSTLPNFLALNSSEKGRNQPAKQTALQASLWQWASGNYALGRIGSGTNSDWILAIERDGDGVAQLDQAAKKLGYSTVPVTIENGDENDDNLVEATAWTRFKTRSIGRYGGRQGSSSLETEVLALHLQQNNYEIFANSLSAVESALISNAAKRDGPQGSLFSNQRFQQAITSLPQPNNGYFYADWPAIASEAANTLPIISLLNSVARPVTAHIDTLAATRQGNAAQLFLLLTQPTATLNATSTNRPSTPKNLTRSSNNARTSSSARGAVGNAY